MKMNIPEQHHNFFIIHRTVNCVLGSLEAVDMHDRKNGPGSSWIDILEPMPSAKTRQSACGELKNQINLRSCGSCLSFAIADDTGNNKIRPIHDGAKGDAENIA
jgi:hypothetical protein